MEDSREKLTSLIRLIKCTSGDARKLVKHCIQFPAQEDFRNTMYLMEKVYGNPCKIFASYRKEIKSWHTITFGDAKGFR